MPQRSLTGGNNVFQGIALWAVQLAEGWYAALLEPLPRRIRQVAPFRRTVIHGPATETVPPNQRLDIHLDQELVFWTEIDIPAEYRHRINHIVGMRLNELSPLPAEQVQTATRFIRKDDEARSNVRVAIVRKSEIDHIAEVLKPKSLRVIAADPKSAESVTIARRPDAPSHLKNAVSSIVVSAVMVALCALAGATQFLERTVEARRADLRDALALAREKQGDLAAWDQLVQSEKLVATDRLDQIITASLPPGMVIERLQIENRIIRVDGFFPSTEPDPELASQGVFTRERTLRPGWDRISYRRPLREDE